MNRHDDEGDLHPPLTPARRSRVEAGVLAFAEQEQELHELRGSLADAKLRIAELELTQRRDRELIDHLNKMIVSAENARDDARAERSEYEVLIKHVKLMLDSAELPPPVSRATLRRWAGERARQNGGEDAEEDSANQE